MISYQCGMCEGMLINLIGLGEVALEVGSWEAGGSLEVRSCSPGNIVRLSPQKRKN